MNELILPEKCDVCCECINICEQECLGILGGVVKVAVPDNCIFCEQCVDICPDGLIEVKYDISM